MEKISGLMSLALIAALALLAIGYSIFLLPITRSAVNAPNENSKLNIAAICDGALAYMTFPSSTEADAFVQECKDGKHPEVIEKWKRDNNITDDRAI